MFDRAVGGGRGGGGRGGRPAVAGGEHRGEEIGGGPRLDQGALGQGQGDGLLAEAVQPGLGHRRADHPGRK